jgi:membrane-bound lytic murein transglycosylase D
MILLQNLALIRFTYRMMRTSRPGLFKFVFLTATSLSLCCTVGFSRAAVPGDAAEASASPEPANTTPDANAPHTAEADERLKRADTHFQTGKQMYFQGNLDGARHEFDAAVDALLSAPDSLPDHRRIERRLDEICDVVYRFDVEKLGAGEAEDAENFDKAPIDEISHMTFPVDENLAPKIKAELNQTASGIPLELSDPVLSFVHYFSTDRGRKILIAGLQRSGRYRSLIQRVFAEEGVPQELMYLAQAESGFLPRAVSNKQAVGMWQFIAGTGSIYSLNRSSAIDERFDPEKATRAAAKYLKDLQARYGDWYLAMAAYNCGAGAVDKAVERTGYADYWELLKRHALPKETASYVPIILAITIMAKNPKDYGLEDVTFDEPIDYESIHLSSATNLNLVADATMQPLSAVRDLNPSLIGMIAPAGFEVHVPKGSAEAARAALETVPAENRFAWRLHHVEAGDTLNTIARAYHLPANRIAEVNHGDASLQTGNLLLIPAVYHEPVQPRARVRGRAKTTVAASYKGKSPSRSGTHIVASRRAPTTSVRRKVSARNTAD